MTGNSVILVELDKSHGSTKENQVQLSQPGCSEFISHSRYHARVVSICTNLLGATNTIAYQQLYKTNPVENMERWCRFVFEAFSCINTGAVPFISLYTIEDFLKEKNFTSGGSPSDNRISITPTQISISSGKYVVTPETVIGISVNTTELRKHFGLRYNHEGKAFNEANSAEVNKKIQIAHTALRYSWSAAYKVPIIAMKLAELNPAADKFHLLQIAYYLRRAVLSENAIEFGSLYNEGSSAFVTKETFMLNWRDAKKSGVQQHFLVNTDPILKMLEISSSHDMNYLLNMNGKRVTHLLVTSPTKEFADFIGEWIKENDQDVTNPDIKAKFKFKRTIFRATVAGMPYEGYKKPGKTVDRILFRDEEGTILSIIQKSELIEIL